MKNKLQIPIYMFLFAGACILLFAAGHMLARQTPASNKTAPCDELTDADKKLAEADKKKDAIEHDPLADPAEELRTRAQKKMEEKNFKELQEAATELAALSGKMSKEIDAGGQFVISLRVLNDLEQIEKLTKKVRSRAK